MIAVLACCAGSEAKKVPKALAEPGPPLTLTVRGPDHPLANSEIELTVTIRRTVVNDAPLQLSVSVPDGATLSSGAGFESIVDGQRAEIIRRVSLRLAKIPSEDVTVDLTVAGGNYGAHAMAKYRFGRPEEKLPEPGHRPHGQSLGAIRN